MEKNNTVVVFMHGILESPEQFSDMEAVISEKFHSAMLLLPGHGKTGRDFAESSMKKWKKYFSDKIDYYRKNYDGIIIAAHSMGCLLSVSEAVKKPEKIKGLFLIANPLEIRLKPKGIQNALRIAFNLSYEDEEFCELIKKVYSVSDCKLSDYPLWIPRYKELISESKKTRQLMEKLTIPSYHIYSDKDEFVSSDSVNYLAKVKNYKLIMLENSGHFYYTEEEREKILNEFRQFCFGLK